MARVLITRPLPGDAPQKLEAAGHEVTVLPGPMPPGREELEAALQDAEGLLCLLTDPVDAGVIGSAPALRAIANCAVGTDNVDLEAAASRDIPVGVTPDVLTDATADLAMALLLAAARRLPEAERDAREGRWRTWEPAGWLGLELRGARLLVVGPGRIGSAVAERARAFGMEVQTAGRDDDLLALLPDADVVSLHCPLTEATRGLIGEAELAAMKPTAILVNTSRGAVVDQPALVRALETGEIGAAALDVTDPEPPAPDDPILSAPNCIVLPHIGSATTRVRSQMASLSADNLIAALDGDPMPYPAR